MDLLKALKRTTILSAVAVLALGATQAKAADQAAVLGHISASVIGTLKVTEQGAMNFGNFTVAGGCATSCTGGATITLSDSGTRTVGGAAGDTLTLMDGVSQSGIVSGTNLETGAQQPGFYTITPDASASNPVNIYVSFATSTGAIIDTDHPNNYVPLTNSTITPFKVTGFTFETDDSTGANGNSGYKQLAASTVDPNKYGTYVPCANTGCTLRVGATLTTIAGVGPVTPGQYTGTYYVMVSY